MTVDTVLFDLDNTLLEYEQDSRNLLSALFDRTGIEPFFELPDYHARYDEFLESGVDVNEQRANCFAAIANEEGHDEETGRAVADAFAEIRDHSRVRCLPGAAEALETLAGSHALRIVTNGSPAMQRTKMVALGIGKYADGVVFVGYDTPAKTSPEPFERALSELDSSPERAVHVGNSLETDVPGTKAAGVDTVGISADPSLTPDPVPDFSFETLHPFGEHPR